MGCLACYLISKYDKSINWLRKNGYEGIRHSSLCGHAKAEDNQ